MAERAGPTFLVVGAPKAGTTSLYEYLKSHPDVFMTANKEPKYFALAGHELDFRGPAAALAQIRYSTVTRLEDYLALFVGGEACAARGEASPMYLHYPGTAERIRAYLPEMKLVAILRNPIERSWSDWLHNVRTGAEEERDFRRALARWSRRRERNWVPFGDYLGKGLYHRHLSDYLRHFPREQMLVLLYDELVQDADTCVRRIFSFLGLAEIQVDTEKRYMVGTPVPRSPRLAAFLGKLEQLLPGRTGDARPRPLTRRLASIPPTMPAEEFAFVEPSFREDVTRLGELLGRDLSPWLRREPVI